MQKPTVKELSFIKTAAAYWQCVFLYNIKKKIYFHKQSGQNKPHVSPYSVPFLFSTENLVDTYRTISPYGKNILTVAASGDHAFDAYLNGARHVETFDYNQWQECVLRLKTDLIHYMNYDQFMNFFTSIRHRQTQQSYDILSPFVPYLSPKAKILVDKFYNPRTDRKYFFQVSPFFWANNGYYKQNNIGYLKSRDDFNTLKKCLPDQIDFTLADADTVAKKLRDEYDIIHLSNIMDYYKNQSYKDGIEFCTNVIRPLFCHLKINGTMIMHYDWGDTDFEYLYGFDNVCYRIIIRDLCDSLSDLDMHFASTGIPAIKIDDTRDTLWLLRKTPRNTR